MVKQLYVDIIKETIKSKDMQEYLIQNMQPLSIWFWWANMICSVPIPLERKAYLLERLSELFYHAINNLCKDMEHYGYKILYEPDDEEIINNANVNEWLFDEFGNVVYDYDELRDCDIV